MEIVFLSVLSIGSGGPTTLNVAPATSVPADHAYGLTFGATSLSSNTTFNVSNNGAGSGRLTLGAVSDGGTNRSITLTGGGTLALSAGGTYGGGTTITSGTLLVINPSGSATGSGTVSMASGTTLAGTGTISGPLTLNGHLSPGIGIGSAGALALGATNLATNSSLDYDLSGLNFDSAHAGALTLGTNLNVNLNLLAGFTLGTYNLVTSTGITGSPTFTVSHSGPGDNPAFSSLYSVSKVGNNIVLVVTAPVQTWKGNSSANWNTTDVNWTPTSLNGGVYADNSYQEVFDDNGSANRSISIPSDVSPLAVTFANTGALSYTITGPGAIAGNGVVAIQGPGTVNLNSPNTYTGGTNLLGGRLNIGDPGASAQAH